MVAKRPQMAIRRRQQAQAARPPTGPRAAARGFTIIECLAYAHPFIYKFKRHPIKFLKTSNCLNNIIDLKKIRFVYLLLLLLCVFAFLVLSLTHNQR